LALAVVVHLLTLAVLALAVVIVTSTVLLIVKVFVGGTVAAIAVAMRPRLGRLSKQSRRRLLRRGDAPRLFALLDQVTTALGGRPIQQVVLTGEVNAGYTTLGLRRRPTLFLGLPLWEALTPQSRVAMLGHEVGHGVNGDLRSALVVSSALESLQLWRYFMRPELSRHQPRRVRRSAARAGAGGAAFGELVAAVVQLPIYLLATGYQRLLLRIDSRSRQRAEYLADELAVRVGSRPATVAVLDTLILAPGVRFLAERCGSLPENGDELRRGLAEIPLVEIERRRRVDARELHAIDASHPPTHLRLRFVHSRPDTSPLVSIDAADEAAIETELSGPAAVAATR
jgi:Zn-dependent protease with chaperone function